MAPEPRQVITTRGYESIAGVVDEPHRSRVLLLVALKRLHAKMRLLERRQVSAFKHERTRRWGEEQIRYVIHRRDCDMLVMIREGVPDTLRSRIVRLEGVWLCQHCKPHLQAVLDEYDRTIGVREEAR